VEHSYTTIGESDENSICNVPATTVQLSKGFSAKLALKTVSTQIILENSDIMICFCKH